MKNYSPALSEKDNRYYYAFEEKIPLIPIEDKYVIRFSSTPEADSEFNMLSSMYDTLPISWKDSRTAIVEMKDPASLTVIDQRAPDINKIYTVQQLYRLDSGMEMPITDEFVISFSESNKQEVDTLHKEFGVTILETNAVFQLLRVPKGGNTLEIANRYQESGFVKFSHPNFLVTPQPFQPAPNDPYFINQFYLQNTGQVFNPVENHAGTPGADINIMGAWDVTFGSSSITVAVLDNGVTDNHPDLPSARQVRLNGSNFAGGNVNDPSPTGQDNHGNACSGIIAATRDNGEGIAGIAPNVKIMPIRMIGANAADTASSILFAANNQAHVLSCSWGYNSQNPNLIPAVVAAIQYAVTNGRGGKGSVVVFAAGNTAAHSLGMDGTVNFPANVNVSGVITVGASDRNDQQADYSPTSNALSPDNQIVDIVAPSHRAYPASLGGIAGETFEIWSIDVPGSVGDNPWPNVPNQIVPPTIGEQLPSSGVNFLSYTGRFGGTSAACPQVAGVVAMILSVDNNLTQQQVFDIVTGSAEKVGGYTYNPNGWSQELGFGRLNAFAALNRIPGRYIISGSNSLCSSSSYVVNGLPSGSVINWSSSDPSIATISASGTADRVGDGPVTFTATINIPNRGGTIVITKHVDVGTLSPWVGGTFNDGGSGINQPLDSTYNQVYYRRIYISLSGSPTEFSWDGFYTHGNITWHHPVSPEGLIIDFGDPLPVYNGDYMGFSVHRTNSCGTKTEPMFFYYAGPTQYFRLAQETVKSTFTITQIDPEQKSGQDTGWEGNVDLVKLQIIDKNGSVVMEKIYDQNTKSATIDVSHLKSDTYLVRLSTTENIEMYQISI